MQRFSFSAFIASRPSDDLRAHLLRFLEAHPRQKLPSVREIGQALRISSRDVVAAIDALRREGLVETRRGSGSWPTGRMPAAAADRQSARPRADTLVDTLREAILQGEHPTGERLPSAKLLARQWGCHPATASKALERLATENVLERDGRGWRPKRPRRDARIDHPLLLLVGAPDDDGGLRMDTDRELDFWRDLSNEAVRNGLETARQPWSAGPILLPPGTLGIVVSTWHVMDVEGLFQAASHTRLPVCTWLEGLDMKAGRWPAEHPRLHLHDVAHSRRAGQEMARHLAGSGFRRVAWINPFGKSEWSTFREEGLRQELASAGVESEGFSLDSLTEWDYLSPAWSDPKLWELAPSIEAVSRGRSRKPIAKIAEQAGLATMLEAWEPHLEEALRWEPDVLVASNDLAATLAKEWLARKGLWNPSRLSLAGFDDSSEALRQDLTSYRFDTGSMARSMVLQILSWKRGRSRADRISRHGGSVVARGSTARGRGITSR